MKLKTLKPRITAMGAKVATMVPGSWRNDKQSSTQRGYGYKWQKAREHYLSAHPLCVYCLREGRHVGANVVDHIIPHKNDKVLFWDSSNWQSLCAHHHSKHKQREEIAAGY